MRIYLELAIRRIDCRNCQGVKQEKLDWLADNPFYPKRFAFYIGRRCRTSSIQDVAKEHLLDWRTVKTLEMQYMREQIKRAGQPRPKVIGIDEISIRKGQTYRIVVSDLDRRRAIWFGGKDRSEESMDMFFAFLGERSSKRVRLSHKENLQGSARKNLKILLAANKRLNTAYVLKESFGQLWDYNREAWARKFFENWRDQLKWQRLKPYEKFAEMIDAHWDGIAA
jgi:transposase